MRQKVEPNRANSALNIKDSYVGDIHQLENDHKVEYMGSEKYIGIAIYFNYISIMAFLKYDN